MERLRKIRSTGGLLVAAAALGLCAGCSQTAWLEIVNALGDPIAVSTERAIYRGAAHSRVRVEDGSVWTHLEISVGGRRLVYPIHDMPPGQYSRRRAFRVSFVMYLKPDSALYVARPIGERGDDGGQNQPQGYPLRPVRPE